MKIGLTPVSTIKWHSLSLRGSIFYSFFVFGNGGVRIVWIVWTLLKGYWFWKVALRSMEENCVQNLFLLSLGTHGRQQCTKPLASQPTSIIHFEQTLPIVLQCEYLLRQAELGLQLLNLLLALLCICRLHRSIKSTTSSTTTLWPGNRAQLNNDRPRWSRINGPQHPSHRKCPHRRQTQFHVSPLSLL